MRLTVIRVLLRRADNAVVTLKTLVVCQIEHTRFLELNTVFLVVQMIRLYRLF